eukprot:TRINITY_DN11742_c0_g2_i1.p1 TRINITY_DN11742_c0_g2~~TRINITY_DN11742_c0_g2_i1.p1  ORF type:complete len:226 (+),score=33.58 TRINITY_DN11742_c0_g2_i1:183-860(+)
MPTHTMKSIERSQDELIYQVVDILDRWASSPNNPNEAMGGDVKKLALMDLGLRGSSIIFKRLGIDMPSFEFTSQCLMKVRTMQADAAMAEFEVKLMKDGSDEKTFSAFTENRYGIPTMELQDDDESRRVQEAFSLFSPQCAPSTLDSEAIHRLIAKVCADICFNLGVSPYDTNDCKAVRGRVSTMITTVPSLVSVGKLLLFQKRFPEVKLEFVEVQATFGMTESM